MKAMTFLEILVVIGIFALVSAITLPLSQDFLNRTRVDATAKTITYTLFRQQQDAYSALNDSSYGVAFFADRYTVFSGNSLATATYQESVVLDSGTTISQINLSTGNEIVFTKGDIKPAIYGDIRISDKNNVNYKVEINSEGMVDYYNAN